MCRLKTQEYRDPRQTSSHNKSVSSPFGRCTLYSLSSLYQFADLGVGGYLQKMECSMTEGQLLEALCHLGCRVCMCCSECCARADPHLIEKKDIKT